MPNDKYNINDIVDLAMNNDALSIQNTLNDLMLQKIHNEIESKKMELSASMFGGTPQEEDDDEYDYEDEFEDDDDLDISDDDLESLLNDLDDLDEYETELGDDNEEY